MECVNISLTMDDIQYQKESRMSSIEKVHRTIACTNLKNSQNMCGTIFISTFTQVSKNKDGGKMMKKYFEKHEYRKSDFDHKANHFMLYDWLRIDKIKQNANRGHRNRQLIEDASCS